LHSHSPQPTNPSVAISLKNELGKIMKR